jgi:phosphoribosyl-AMP cyclohydrolase
MTANLDLHKFDFNKLDGLIPAIVQAASDREILMVGFMNRDALKQTLAEGYVTFFSRTREQLWMKGETSGNRLRVVSAATDCDRDTILLCVEVEGAGIVCHRGIRSCFTEPISFEPAEPSPTLAAKESQNL